MSVMGEAAPSSVARFTRNGWPSEDMAYCWLLTTGTGPPAMRTGNRAAGVPPDSFELYAIQLPSEGNRPSRSSNGVFKKGNGFLSPETGRTQKSQPVCGSLLRNSIKRPSEDQSVGTFY